MPSDLKVNMLRWLDLWDESLQIPERVLASDGLGNVLLALRTELQTGLQRRPRNFDPLAQRAGFKGDLIIRLRGALQGGGDAFLEFLKANNPNGVRELAAELNKTSVDPAALYSRVASLVSLYEGNARTLLGSIEADLYASGSASFARLSATSEALIRQLLFLDDPKALSRLPEENLCVHGIKAALEPELPSFLKSKGFRSVEVSVSRAAKAAQSSNLSHLLDKALPENRGLWYGDLFTLAREIHGTLKNVGASTLSASILTDAGFTAKIGRAAVRASAGQVLDHAIGRLGRPLLSTSDSEAAAYVAVLDSLMTEAILPWVRELPSVTLATQPSYSALGVALSYGDLSLK